MNAYALDHPVVRDYLERLDRATAHLPPDERADVVQGIREHLSEALLSAQSEADVHNVLDALGRPEDIVDPPVTQPMPAPSPAAPNAPTTDATSPPDARSGRGALEIIAVVLLLIGGVVVPVVGWIVGVVLLWISKAWTTPQKLLGTFVVPGGLMGSFIAVPFAFFIPVQTCTTSSGTSSGRGVIETVEVCSAAPSGWVTGAALVLAIAAPIAVAIYLLRAAGRNRPEGATAGG